MQVSERHFQRVCRELVGKTPLRTPRSGKAMELLTRQSPELVVDHGKTWVRPASMMTIDIGVKS